MKNHKLALHIFRRDLRLQDNTALLHALNHAEEVIPAFIFDPRQVDKNRYKSSNAIQFMLDSLAELDQELRNKGSRLYFFYGTAEEVVAQLKKSLPINLVTINRDYTPFALKRDKKITDQIFPDALLQEPESVHKKDGTPYTVFTFFARLASQLPVAKPRRNSHKNYYTAKIKGEESAAQLFKKILPHPNPDILLKGGRSEALKILKKVPTLSNYKKLRDIPAEDGTTHLSAHNKFGTVSIREVYHAVLSSLGPDHTLITELYWRDFFTHIAHHFPHVFSSSFHRKYDRLQWRNSKKLFQAWCEGKTGFPIVDAGMRELNATGYMHNRVRMITASFLVKDLHISWRWGEQYFARQLVDYDPAVNNGNWQWAASTGCDAQPYFRIFNPWRQQQRFDPDCKYIKKWVPELAALRAKEIQKLEKPDVQPPADYLQPIVNHKEASAFAKEMYKSLPSAK